MSANARGRLFILSAPSGGGKTTLRLALFKKIPGLAYSVSHTTRKPRQRESNGRDYYFINKDEFLLGIKKGRWAEWAEVHGNYYGTSANFIDRCLAKGFFVVLDIDVQGTRKILKKFPDAVTIFIKPPSMDVLRQRLMGRNTDDDSVVKTRLANAKWEMAQSHIYMHTIINDQIDDAISELADIVRQYMPLKKA